ncbi:MAG: ATP-dependent 6-phosphofructokinase [bacterium]
MDRVAVLTSGGDAPGMNDAIRGFVRTALDRDLEVIGFKRGYEGLVNNEYDLMDSPSVGNILERGGTILRTYRSERFREEKGLKQACNNLDSLGVEGLVTIGGDGTFRGAMELNERWDGQVVGIPATIDNDIAGTEICIGFNTAVSTALNALDKIRDTATSHERTFIIEVMGRNSGHIALSVGLAGGAEEILVPEIEFDLDDIADRIINERRSGKPHYIVVLAEGAGEGFDVSEKLQRKSDMQTRLVVLGHIQRGGSPVAQDRIGGSKMGYHAVDTLFEGETGISVGLHEGQRNLVAFEEAIQGKSIDRNDLEIARTLSSKNPDRN